MAIFNDTFESQVPWRHLQAGKVKGYGAFGINCGSFIRCVPICTVRGTVVGYLNSTMTGLGATFLTRNVAKVELEEQVEISWRGLSK